jgi:hypothetical protein
MSATRTFLRNHRAYVGGLASAAAVVAPVCAYFLWTRPETERHAARKEVLDAIAQTPPEKLATALKPVAVKPVPVHDYVENELKDPELRAEIRAMYMETKALVSGCASCAAATAACRPSRRLMGCADGGNEAVCHLAPQAHATAQHPARLRCRECVTTRIVSPHSRGLAAAALAMSATANQVAPYLNEQQEIIEHIKRCVNSRHNIA